MPDLQTAVNPDTVGHYLADRIISRVVEQDPNARGPFPVKVYLAARFNRQHDMRRVASLLANENIPVTARWFSGTHDYPQPGESEMAFLDRAGREDLEDIRDSTVLVFFAETPDAGYMSGGRHVEMGYAMALGIPVIVVGQKENVFHHLVNVTVLDTFADALAALVVARDRLQAMFPDD